MLFHCFTPQRYEFYFIKWINRFNNTMYGAAEIVSPLSIPDRIF